MGKMVGGWGVMLLVVLVVTPADAIWSGRKEPATAGEAAREYAKEAVRNTADAAANVGESVKQTANAAYDTVRTVTGGWSDRGTDGPTGAAYRDRSGNYVADTAATAQRRAADAAAAVRNTAAGTAQAARDTGARAYDATADTVGSARDKVWGAPEPEPTITQRAADAARRASGNVRDGASRAYDSTADTVGSARGKVWGAPEPEPTITQRAADAARRASDTVRDGASRAYDTTADTVGSARDKVWGAPEPEPTITQRAADAARRASGNVRDGVWGSDNRGAYDRAIDSASRAGQATRDSTYRAMGYEAPAEKSYASRAYDSVAGSSSDAYESGKNRLGSIIEILGWQRAPDQDDVPTTSHLGRYSSPYDVVVGNTRYVWHQKPEEPQSYYESAKNTVGSATQTVADKAKEGTNTVVDAAARTKDATVETASRATESVKNVAGKTGETVSEISQKSRDAINANAAAVEQKLAKPGFFRRLWRLLHLLTWGATFGTAVWMTFMSGRLLQQHMPREQFRTVQTKIFPSYLRFLTAGEGALTFLYMLSSRSTWWQIFNLLLLSGATAYNAYVLEPQTTKLYMDRLRLEKEEGRGLSDVAESKVTDELAEKNKKFKEIHGYSASLNLLSLVGLTYHAWHIVSRLHA